MGAGLNTGWRVTARVVSDWASNVASQLSQVVGQLVNPVDGSQVDLARFVVDHQMCETSFRRGEGEEGGGGGSSGGGRHGEGEEKEEDGGDKERWVEVGRHGGEGGGVVSEWA